MAIKPAIQDNYEALLLAYAAGVLDQAQQFAVAVHLALSPPARKFVQHCEAIGGTLIECECAPVPMNRQSLGDVLSRLDAPPQQTQTRKTTVRLPPEIQIPIAILETVSCRPCAPQWKRSFAGLSMCELPLECRQSTVRFIKSRPAARIPHHAHGGLEITLVLDGAYEDEYGLYRRGDMVVLDEHAGHETQACRNNGVVAMVVSGAPVRFSGLAGLLNAFLR